MEEARRVLERLERIDGLRRAQASPAVLLREVRALLDEGQGWLAVERAGVTKAGPGSGHRAEAIQAADGIRGGSGSNPDPADPNATPVDANGPEPIGRAADALAQLDTVLASRAGGARDGEVMREPRAI